MEYIKNIRIGEYRNLEMIRPSPKGYVMKGLNKSGQMVLLKSFFKSKKNSFCFIYDPHKNMFILREMFYLSKLTGKHFVPTLFDYHDGVDLATVVMEYLDKDWFHLGHFVDRYRDERVLKIVMKKVILIMYEMEKMGYYHCDIKPDNIMVNHITLEVKFIDFEDLYLNKSFDPLYRNPDAGTMEFKSPESFSENPFYLLPSLVFNIGCILYCCQQRTFPYCSIAAVFDCESFKITKSPKSLESLIRLCTKLKPRDRINFHDLLHHEWFNSNSIFSSSLGFLNNLWKMIF